MRVSAVLMVLAFVGCADAVPAATTPATTTPTPPSGEIIQGPSASPNALAAANDAHRAQVAAWTAQVEANQQAAIDGAKRAQSEAQAAKDAEKARCAASREDRLNNVKVMIGTRMKAEARVIRAAPAIRAACKLGSRPTGAVRISSSSGGMRAAPETQATLQCGTLPAGITKDDAYVLLAREQQTGDITPSGAILESEDYSPDDGVCRAHDLAAGLDLYAPRYHDESSVQKLIDWKQP